jgi:copper chaperone CopZ
METRTIAIEGMSCGHCVARVTKVLSALPGVSVTDVSVGSARITFDPSTTTLARLGEALDAAGFRLAAPAAASGR